MPYVSGRLAELDGFRPAFKFYSRNCLAGNTCPFVPVVHAKGIVKRFSPKESWGNLLYECALNCLSSVGQ